MSQNNLHNLSGEKKDQLLIVCDKKGNKLTTATREKCHQGDGITHLAFMVYLVDKNRKIILSKRAKNKSLWPGYWDASVVSHVSLGETFTQAARRRTGEELAVVVDSFSILGGFYYFAKQDNIAENEYCHVLMAKSEGQIHPNSIEISKIKKVSFEKLRKEVEMNPSKFTPWLRISLKKFSLSSYLP